MVLFVKDKLIYRKLNSHRTEHAVIYSLIIPNLSLTITIYLFNSQEISAAALKSHNIAKYLFCHY